MILSASRRTDLPAFYAAWLLNRLQAGYALTANPYNPKQQKRVDLTPGAVDGLVLWSKNPAPLLGSLDILDRYAWYLNATLTTYGEDIEPLFAPQRAKITEALRRFAGHTGPRRLRWRYDPLLFGGIYTPAWHAEQFTRLAKALGGAAESCTISFYDEYAHTRAPMAGLGLRAPTPQEQQEAAVLLAQAAAAEGVRLYTCAEAGDYSALGIEKSACVDRQLLEETGGWPIKAKRDSAQRPGCGCAQSVDLGAYNTCPGGCVYCYARRAKAASDAAPGLQSPTAEGFGPAFRGG